MERTFHLYAFSDGDIIVITRGETVEQAMTYAARDNGLFPRGVTIYSVGYLPLDAAKLYSLNHDAGWLHRLPEWLRKKENKEAVQKGSSAIIDDIKTTLQNRLGAQS